MILSALSWPRSCPVKWFFCADKVRKYWVRQDKSNFTLRCLLLSSAMGVVSLICCCISCFSLNRLLVNSWPSLSDNLTRISSKPSKIRITPCFTADTKMS